MTGIQLLIEGKEAVNAVETLVAALSELPEVSGEWQKIGDDTQHDRAMDMGTLADIVSMTGCSAVAVAQIIYNWYVTHKREKSENAEKPLGKEGFSKRLEKVLLICGKRRLVMKDASLEDIERFLEKC